MKLNLRVRKSRVPGNWMKKVLCSYCQSWTKLSQFSSSSGKTGKMPSSLTTQDYQVCITVIEARHLAGVNMDPVVCVQVSPRGPDNNKIILWPITLGRWLQEVYFSQGINKLSLLQWGVGEGKNKCQVYFKSFIDYFMFQYFVFDFHMAPVMLYDKIISFTVRPPQLNLTSLCSVL